MTETASPTTCEATGLRIYKSARAARSAHRKVSHRLRIFRCKACGNHHVSHEAKGERA